MKRIRTIDLAKGFAVLTLAPIHALIIFASPEAQKSILAAVLYFLAEGPGAQLFMILMGVSFIFSSRTNFSEILKRAAIILAAGYALNFLKFVLPLWFNLFPDTILIDLQVGNKAPGWIFVFLTGDILQFAGIALLLLFLIRRLPYYHWCSLGLALTVCFISPFLYDLHSNNFIASIP